ncbi:MAG: hypothetical protein ACOC7T_05665 [Planctomycetota bacterium]
MSNYLTDGRTALLAALKADADLQSLVKTWLEAGPGLRRREHIEPAWCPAVGVRPGGVRRTAVANVETEVVQSIRVEVRTDGQDAGACEELVELVLGCVRDADATCLGLSAEGLVAVRARAVELQPLPNARAARPLWRGTAEVQLTWRRT